jgi:SAM-dependent methyltransferase
MPSVEKLIRTLIPSTVVLSHNPAFRLIGNPLSQIPALLYPEFRDLPPNHLRVRVGVGNRLLFNQTQHLQIGKDFWPQWLAAGYVSDTSEIVEIGCGCGRVAHHLRNEWFKGTYVGIDIDEELLAWDSSNFPKEKFTFLRSSHASVTYTSKGNDGSTPHTFPANWQKDFIYSTSLYTHLLEEELLNYTRESYRVLRPNKVMYMTFFCMDSVEIGKRWTFQHKMGQAHVENIKYPEAAVAYTRAYMEELCSSVGFREVSIIESPWQSALVCRK